MNAVTYVILRGLLQVILFMTLLAQVFMLPGLAKDAAHSFPEVAYLELPYLVVAIVGVVCVQVILVAVWVLLWMVSRDSIFTERAFIWVDVIIGAASVATLLALGLGVHMLGFIGAGGPGVLLTASIRGAND